MKEMGLTPNASPSDDKKSAAFKKLIEKGKQVGHLSTQDIDTLIVDLDLDVDELEKLKGNLDKRRTSNEAEAATARALGNTPMAQPPVIPPLE